MGLRGQRDCTGQQLSQAAIARQAAAACKARALAGGAGAHLQAAQQPVAAGACFNAVELLRPAEVVDIGSHATSARRVTMHRRCASHQAEMA